MSAFRHSFFAWGVVIALAAAAFLLRVYDISELSLSHPEIYIPGIDLIDGISTPPPRHTWGHTLLWHFHTEPHPIGWYMAMFGWTELFGTSPAALRMPSVIIAALTVPLIFLVGRRAFSAPVGVLAAAMLAFHGFHAHWGQLARMYSAGTFLTLLSILLLMRLRAANGPRPGLEAGYIATIVAATQTVELAWAIAGMQLIWLLFLPGLAGRAALRLLARPPQTALIRMAQVQAMALAIASPGLAHAAYLARSGAAESPSLRFLTEFFTFGTLFETVPGQLHLATPAATAFFAIAVALVLLSLRHHAPTPALDRPVPGVPVWLRLLATLAGAAGILFMAAAARHRGVPMAALTILPVLALAVPGLAAYFRALLHGLSGRVPGALARRVTPDVMLLWLVAIVAPLLLYLASYKLSVLATRAFMVFTPSLLILCAAGAWAAFSTPWKRVTLISVIAMIFIFSNLYNEPKLSSPRDYKALAAEMLKKMHPDDLVLVRPRHWVDTPLFYYLRDARYVAADYRKALDAAPDARVWMVTWPPSQTDSDRPKALEGYHMIDSVSALRALAELYVRDGSP